MNVCVLNDKQTGGFRKINRGALSQMPPGRPAFVFGYGPPLHDLK